MRIKKITSLLGVWLVLSVGLMTVNAAEQQNLHPAEQQGVQTVQTQLPEKAKYKPISDVRHVVPPYDEQDHENTKQTEDINLDKSSSAAQETLAMEGTGEQNEVSAVSKDGQTDAANAADIQEDEKTAVVNAEEAAETAVEQPVSDKTVTEPKAAVENTEPVEQKSTPAEPQNAAVEPVQPAAAPADSVQQTEETPKAESGYEAIKNKLWCITFQLVWNTFMDKVTHGPVLLAGGNPPIANELNKKLYTSDLLNENSYYTTYGKISKSLKRQIERAIEKKFHETSDILDTINWEAKNSYLFYAMLKKDFNFETPFDKLTSAPFNGSTEKVKYFGVNKDSERKLRKNVHVLFYNSPDEYAVKLVTKEKEDVILYRTDKKDSFENLYLYVMQQDVSERFAKEDSLMVPNFKIDKTISYDELCGKKIKGTNKVITQALQTIKFNMDNKGGTLKSEAALAVMRMSLAPEIGRKYNFDKEFVLFLKEEGKDKPYFAVRVENPEFLDKE